MAIERILPDQFLELSKLHPILDVRSPGEFEHAHIPGAFSLPLFTDEERKVVGTAYKQQSKEIAVKLGLDYFGIKMRSMVENVENLLKEIKTQLPPHYPNLEDEQLHGKKQSVLVHCWRGGMRSAGVAWLLDLYGFKVYTLAGGYKAYRKWVRSTFDEPYNLTVLGGFTGSGKTLVLHELIRLGHPVIDLENLAHHKGSAFGGLWEGEQPTQEMFENLLAKNLVKITLQKGIKNTPIFIEDESQRIGKLNIPANFWQQMRQSPICFLEISFNDRLNLITDEYGKLEPTKLADAIVRLQKRLGGNETKMALRFLMDNNLQECFSILLKYYDKWYEKGLKSRENLASLLTKIVGTNTEISTIAKILVDKEITA